MSMSLKAAVIAGLVHSVLAVPAVISSSAAGTGVPTLTISTSVASPSASLSATLPAQAPLPPTQDWCIGQIFCAGSVRPTFSVTS
jgi:alpha,alpha-trehalase